MAKPETEKQVRTRRLKYWKFTQAVIDYKRGNRTEEEACDEMSYWTGIDPELCGLMLKEMRKDNIVYLQKAQPHLPFEPDKIFDR